MENDPGLDRLEPIAVEPHHFAKSETRRFVDRLQPVLRNCCAKLPMRNSWNKSGDNNQPTEKFITVDSSGENLKGTFTLVGDNVAKAEVSVRHPKMASHFYRAVVQPDVQWRLQQLQDFANFTLIALEKLNLIRQLLDNKVAVVNDDYATRLFLMADEVLKNLLSARAALTSVPKLSIFTRVRENRLRKCFVPTIPNDLSFNLYISSNKLCFCAIYTPNQPSEKDILQVYESECYVPWFSELLISNTSALKITKIFCQMMNATFSWQCQRRTVKGAQPGA